MTTEVNELGDRITLATLAGSVCVRAVEMGVVEGWRITTIKKAEQPNLRVRENPSAQN